MGRIKLDIPEQLPFSCEVTVRVSDLNYGAHLGNDKVLSLIHDARVSWLIHLGLSEQDACGVGIIQIDAAIQYKAEGFLGDRIRIDVGATEFNRMGWDFLYRLSLPKKGKLLALAKTGMAAFNYSQGKVVSVPDELRCLLGG